MQDGTALWRLTVNDQLTHPQQADSVLKAMRCGQFPRGNDAEKLDRPPLIDALRSQATASDIAWLLPLINHEDDKLAGLAASMLRMLRCEPGVRETYEARWRTGTPYLKARIMWRLLDFEDIDAAWHLDFRKFVLDTWGEFSRYNLGFYGRDDVAIAKLMPRLEDGLAPASKRWIQLCVIPSAVSDRERASGLMDSVVKRFPELKAVHRELLEHLAPRQ
jgi:hypothetical protein